MTEQQQNTESGQKDTEKGKPTNPVEKAANMGKEAAAAAMGFTNPFRWGKKKEEPKAEAAPAPAPEAAPQPQAQQTTTPAAEAKAERTYTVQAGDTLWDIATRFYGDGTQYRKIASANNIANPDLINVGQRLTIPE